MNNQNISVGYSNFVVTLLLLFPVVIGSVKIVGNLILLILVFMGTYTLFKEKKSPFKVPELKLFSWITFSYFIVMLLSIVQNEGLVNELHHLGRKAHFLLAPLIVLAIYKVNVPLVRLLFFIKISLIVAGCIIFFQSYNDIFQGYNDGDRHSGMYNANIFGDIVLVLIFLSIVRFFEESPLTKLFTFFCFSLGIYAIIGTHNRGSILMLIILFAIYLVVVYKKYFISSSKYKFIFPIVFIALIGVLSNNFVVKAGLNNAIKNTTNWVSGSDIMNSSSIRLEMWSGSFEAFKNSPWTGYGYRSANTIVSKYVHKDVQHSVKAFTHLHNEYITNLISAGIFGLVSVLLLLLLPLKVFIHNIKSDETFLYSFMGLLLCLSYAGIGMTHIAFGEEHVNAVYVFFLAILLPKVIQQSRQPT